MALTQLEMQVLEEIRSDVRDIKEKQASEATAVAVLTQRVDTQDTKIEAQGKRIDKLAGLGGVIASVSAGLGGLTAWWAGRP